MKIPAVVGFLFNNDATEVVLIKKNKPSHLKGLWNGVGGKIEEGETPAQAMRREFNEETGVDYAKFEQVAIGETGHWILHYFVGFNTEAALSAFNAEEEMVDRFSISDMWKYWRGGGSMNRIWWLVPMLLDMHRTKSDEHQILGLTRFVDLSK